MPSHTEAAFAGSLARALHKCLAEMEGQCADELAPPVAAAPQSPACDPRVLDALDALKQAGAAVAGARVQITRAARALRAIRDDSTAHPKGASAP